MKQNRFKSLIPLTAFALSLFTGCGPQSFVPTTTGAGQKAAGGINIPPKVDIVLGISSNGTMRNILPGITSEIPKFLTNLQNAGWDYRFVSIPLSQYHPTDASNLSITSAVSVSKYDANYNLPDWLIPFPGADYLTAPKIASYLFSNTFNVTQLNPTDPVDNHESGFHNELTFLNRSDVQNDFLRPDALLAVITLSNADDRSDWHWGAVNTTDQGYATVDQNTYRNQFLAVKNNAPTQIKYYAAVAHLTTSCRGYGDWSGLRYEEMAGLLGGSRVDICSNTIADSLTAIQNNLNIVRLSYRKKYLVIGVEPKISTISVTKYSNGTASTLPQDGTNGWTYFGKTPTSGVYTIDSPIPMDMVNAGYLIELHGTAKLNGDETATVNYQNEGVATSH